jgi:hypothetical protein
MPVEYRVYEPEQLAVWTATGVASDAEWRACENRSRQDPRSLRIPYVLVDVTRQVSVPSKSYMEGLVRRLLSEKRAPDSRWAIVASQDASAGVSYQVAAHLEGTGLEVRVFRNRERAEAWLRAEREKRGAVADPGPQAVDRGERS